MGLFDGVVNATASFGKIRMEFAIIFSIIVGIISLFVLIWLFFSFEKNYITTKATIIEDPVCKTDRTDKTDDQNIISGTVRVKFRYNNKDYSIQVNADQGCYNYTKNSSINVKFDPNDVESTTIIATNDPKGIFILVASIFLIVSIFIFVYNYTFRNNKVAETISGAQGVTQGIRSLI